MTDDPYETLRVSTTDHRRACAFIVHHAHHDMAGLDAVLDEANAQGRIVHLLLALCEVYQRLVPELRTPMAITFMTDAIMRMAEVETA